MLAATNRPEILDPRCVRDASTVRCWWTGPTRGRVQILNVHMKKVTLAPDVDAEKVAALTPGFRAPILPISSTRQHCSPRAARPMR